MNERTRWFQGFGKCLRGLVWISASMMMSGSGVSESVEAPTTPVEGFSSRSTGTLASACSGDVPGRARYNVLQIVWDTTRAANLGVYGYERNTTPFLDQAAQDAGVVFNRCHAEGSWTSPSVATMFTGLIPQTHKVHTEATRLAEGWNTTAEMLSARGYRTALITGNGMLTEKDRNFGQGFDEVAFYARPDAQVTDAFLAWVDSTGSEPFFGHVQYFAAHGPYAPSAAFDSLFIDDEHYGVLGDAPKINPAGCFGGLNPGIVVDSLLSLDYYVAQYDALIREADFELSRLMDGLESRGLADSTLVILTADHGEMLAGEHNFFFCHASFFEGNSHIPLVLWLPPAWQAEHRDLGGLVDDRNVGLVDLLPSTLDLLGITMPQNLQGTSLFSYLHPDMYLGGEGDRRYLGFGTKKMIHYGLQTEDPRLVTLYNPIWDPREATDIAPRFPELTEMVADSLEKISAAAENTWLSEPPGVYIRDDFENSDDSNFRLYTDRKPSPDLYWTIRPRVDEGGSQALYGYAAETASQSFETGAVVVVEAPKRSYAMEADLRLERGGVGIAIAYQPWIRVGYRLLLQPDRALLYTVWKGEAQLLTAKAITLDPAEWVHLRLRANHGMIVVDLDGEELMRAMEPRWETIGGGTMFTPMPGTSVWLDNLVLARL